MNSLNSVCPKCGYVVLGPFPYACPVCDFDITGLSGRGTSTFQVQKWDKHTDLYFGRNIRLGSNEVYNASFDYNGIANIDDIVRFTITYGDRTILPDSRGNNFNEIIIAYIPEQIGAGTAIHFPGQVPCSGICLISPKSKDYSHPFPVIDEWKQVTFSGISSQCRICGAITDFAQPVCERCYRETNFDWRSFI